MQKTEPNDYLKSLYQKMYDMTNAKCRSFCPGFCCEPIYCERVVQTLGEAAIEKNKTDHPTMCFMGPEGCTLEPWQRPMCTIHMCEYHLLRDAELYQNYMSLRQKLSELEFERGDFGHMEFVTPFYGL